MITLSTPLPSRWTRHGKTLGEVFDRSGSVLKTEALLIKAFGTHPANLLTYHACPMVSTLPGKTIAVTTPAWINALCMRIDYQGCRYSRFFYLLTPSGFVRAAWAGNGERLVLLYSEYETIIKDLSSAQLSKLYFCGAITDQVANNYLFNRA